MDNGQWTMDEWERENEIEAEIEIEIDGWKGDVWGSGGGATAQVSSTPVLLKSQSGCSIVVLSSYRPWVLVHMYYTLRAYICLY